MVASALPDVVVYSTDIYMAAAVVALHGRWIFSAIYTNHACAIIMQLSRDDVRTRDAVVQRTYRYIRPECELAIASEHLPCHGAHTCIALLTLFLAPCIVPV